MRIGFDAKRAFHNFRGLGNYSRDLIAGLNRYYPNDEYFLFTPPFSDDRAKKWLDQYSKLNVVEPSGFFNRKFSSVWRSLFLTEDIDKKQLDIFHGLSHELPKGIEKSNVRSIVTIHDLIFMRYPNFFPWIDRQVYLKKFKYACESSDLVIAICEQTKRDLVSFLNVDEKKIRVVYQSCNPRFYTPLEEEEINTVLRRYGVGKNFILYVGAIEERKNALSLVKAYASLKKSINHELILIGNGGDYKTEVENYIASKGLGNRVKILTTVDNADLPAFYQGSSLFCYPSFFEGFGIPIIEALYSKTPVITSEGSCFPEAGGPNSIYIDPKSVEQIASAIERVLTDSELRFDMVENGRNFVEKFHRSKTSENIMNVYRELV
ncbi:glycosyltransferase family 1 protein [Bacteriovorax sp. Seq25_V]|uniref:glycosyltransferase family 4 protein n=1 Tax=Bacteriovorax sp. Seq25_V TaxID=1201288 RepID=UPI00038A2131|nr:glycosyltransferase family 1 protein [Bacteriovorax sp. Seq25_V]EQC45642.1 glycosyltransferase, group 1 family protein [Bacteriovorax sp. Seq25_V]